MRSWHITQRGDGRTLVLGFLLGPQLDTKLREAYPNACIATCAVGDPTISEQELIDARLAVGAGPRSDVHLIGWSAGCQAIRTILGANLIDPARIKLVMCLDGTAATYPQIGADVLRTWRDLFARAERGEIRAIFTCTSMTYVERLPIAAGKQGPYMATRHVLERVLSEDPIARSSPSEFDAAQKAGRAFTLEVGKPLIEGSLYVERYASNDIDAEAHVHQVNVVMPALLASLKDATPIADALLSIRTALDAFAHVVADPLISQFEKPHQDADKMIEWCRAEMLKGVKEDHPGTKRSKRIDEYLTSPQYMRNGQALHLLGVNWCAAAQSMCHLECGHPEIPAFVSGVEFETWAKHAYRWVGKDIPPKKGWLAIYLRGTGPSEWERHVTRVTIDADAETGAYETIGGNEAGGAWGQDKRPPGATDATLSGFVMV